MDLTLVWSRIRVRVTCRVKVRASISIRPTKIISMVPVTYPEKIRVGRSVGFILFYFILILTQVKVMQDRFVGLANCDSR